MRADDVLRMHDLARIIRSKLDLAITEFNHAAISAADDALHRLGALISKAEDELLEGRRTKSTETPLGEAIDGGGEVDDA